MRALLLLALASCGSITLAPDAAPAPVAADHTVTSHDGGELEAPTGTIGATDARLPDAGADVKSCAPYTSPPYCSSCRDSRGVCRCGALPCCDQYCQS